MSGQVVDQLRQELSVATSLGQLEQLVDAVQEAYNKSPDLLEELLRLLPEIFAKEQQLIKEQLMKEQLIVKQLKQRLRNSGTRTFQSVLDFLLTYTPSPWELLPIESPLASDVKSEPPPKLVIWSTFVTECQALLAALPEGGPVYVPPMLDRDKVGSEERLQDELLWDLILPLERALDTFFQYDRMRRGVEGLPANAGHPDFLLLTHDMRNLLVTVEVKTSDVLFVPPGSSLPAAYAAASKDTATSNVLTCVQQLYSYLGRVPFGVLLTDQQLFCVRREGSTLLCSPSIPVAPVAAQQQDKAEGGRGGNASLTAVGALYGIMMMSKLWWAAQQLEQQQPQPQPLEPQGGRRGGELRPIPQLSPTPPPPAATESQLTSSQLFPGCNLGPPVPGETVPRCLGDSRWGVVMQGSLGGWPAAVKLVDLWQGREAKEAKEALQCEVRVYQQLQQLQGLYVPRLLGYGFCDGWQYFVATSLEGAPLNRKEGWALGKEATCAAAFAALDAVHARGVLHGDVELRNFVLASQPAAARGGGAAGPYPTQSSFTSLGGGYGGGTSRSSDGEQQQQQQPRAPQPCVMLLDFGLAKLVDEAAEEWGVEPAQLLQQERMELQALLRWEPPLPVPAGAGSGAEAADAAAASGGSGENAGNVKPGHNQQGSAAMCVEQVAGSPAAGISRPSPPAAVHSGRRPPAGLLPVPPPRLPCGLGGWRQQHSLRSHVPHNNLIRLQPVRHGGRGAASSSSRRTSSLRTTWGL